MSDKMPPRMAGPGSAAVGAAPDAAALQAAQRAARRRVRMLQGWRIHALVYVVVIGGLWVLYAFVGSAARFPWPLAPTLGWGLGLGIHGLVVWLGTSRRHRQWESRKMEQYMQEELADREGAGR